jgi:hypothetical protein
MFYPYNSKMGQQIQTDVPGVPCDRAFLAHYHIDAGDCEAAGAAIIIAAVTLGTGVTVTKLAAALDGQPKCGRVMSITGNAATATGNVVFTGKDLAGETITETIVSTGAATVNGTKVFAFVDSIVFPARGAAGDTISVGMTDDFGIPFKIPYNTVLAIYNNKTLTTVASGGYSATTLALNFLNPAAALSDSDIDVYLMV